MLRRILILSLLAASVSPAQSPPQGAWGDQHDGSYVNPILPLDVSDLDAIRVGGTFYAITSTFQYSPGMAILQSEDLVQWRFVAHVVEDVSRITPAMNWDHMDRAGRGIWAGSIRFQAGRFWVVFGTPDEGIFVSSAASITGPWTPVVPVLSESGWDDPCPFWDDDGKVFLVATHFKPEADGKNYHIHLFRLTPDLQHIVPGSDRILHQSRGAEANKLYKINGLYLHLFSEVTAEGRVVMMERAKSLDGPWEQKQLIHVHAASDKEPNQGGLIELPDHRWFFLTHQGRGDWEGRAGVLLPVTWIDGWPILGQPGPDGIGNMVWRNPDPLPLVPASPVQSDDFSAPTLNPAWEWNYQPRPASWSLSQRPGFLRLYALPPLRPNDFFAIPDILTQRATRAAFNQITVKVDLSGMVPGQEFAVAHFAKTYSTLGVIQHGSVRTLTLNQDGLRSSGPVLTGAPLWIRSTWDFSGLSQWSYSLDGEHFKDIGSTYPLTWAHYRGDRIGLVTFNAVAAGFVDIDSFTYTLHQP